MDFSRVQKNSLEQLVDKKGRSSTFGHLFGVVLLLDHPKSNLNVVRKFVDFVIGFAGLAILGNASVNFESDVL